MATPDPNSRPDIPRERPAGAMIALALVVIFALALVFWWMMDRSADAPGPDTLTIEQNGGDAVAPSAAEGEGAVDLPDPVEPEVITPAPAPDLTPAPDAAGDATTGGTTGTSGGTSTTP